MAIELMDILTHDYQIIEDVDMTAIEPSWQDLLLLVTPDRSGGVYSLACSIQFSLDSTSQDFLYQFSTDGGTNWGAIYEKRVKGRGNIEILEVLDLIDHAGGVMDLRCRVSKSGNATCTIIKAIFSLSRKS